MPCPLEVHGVELLGLREAELVRTQTQLKDMKRKVDNLFAQFHNSGDSLL